MMCSLQRPWVQGMLQKMMLPMVMCSMLEMLPQTTMLMLVKAAPTTYCMPCQCHSHFPKRPDRKRVAGRKEGMDTTEHFSDQEWINGHIFDVAILGRLLVCCWWLAVGF